MTTRERLRAILNGTPPDRLPWIPRIQLWYEAGVRTDTMPAEWKGLTLREVERRLGIGTPARSGKVFDSRCDGAEIVTRVESGATITEYRTPVGTVRSAIRGSVELDRQGLPGRIQEYPLKGPEDYRVWEYLLERSRWDPAYDEYAAYDAEIGQDGLPMVSVGDVPIHDFLLNLAGYGSGYYQLADHPREVERLLTVMTEVQRERMWPVVLDSPAELLLHGVHLSSQFTPPALFERYILPYYQELMPLIHGSGKRVAMHADNDTSQILRHIEEAGWDMVECFVTAPMVPLTMDRARRAWGKRVIIWGGIPSILLSPSVPDDQFRPYCHDLLDTLAPGDAFILGVADNVMPDSLIDRVAWVTELLEERGGYPVE